MRILVCVWLAVALTIGRARAEDIAAYEVESSAMFGAPDPRVAALDEAFARAVVVALDDVIEGELRRTHQQVIDREITARARLWVARFTVVKDETTTDRRHLKVTVQVDRDRIRARLTELGVVPRPSASAVVLVRIQDGERMRANYGPAPEREVPGHATLAARLSSAGVALRGNPATETPARGNGELPLSDSEALVVARKANATIAVVVGVTVGPRTLIRGVATDAALVVAHVRIVGADQRAVQASAHVAAHGGGPGAVTAAIDRAVAMAGTEALPRERSSAGPGGHDQRPVSDEPLTEPGMVLVRLPLTTPFTMVAALLRYLEGAKGIQRVAIRRVSWAGWVIGVSTTESIQRIANIVRTPPATDTSAEVKIAGEIVELVLSAGGP